MVSTMELVGSTGDWAGDISLGGVGGYTTGNHGIGVVKRSVICSMRSNCSFRNEAHEGVHRLW